MCCRDSPSLSGGGWACVQAYGQPHSRPQPPPLLASSAQLSLLPVLSSLTGCLLDISHVFNLPSRLCTCNQTWHSVSSYGGPSCPSCYTLCAVASFPHVPLRVSPLWAWPSKHTTLLLTSYKSFLNCKSTWPLCSLHMYEGIKADGLCPLSSIITAPPGPALSFSSIF